MLTEGNSWTAGPLEILAARTGGRRDWALLKPPNVQPFISGA